MTPTQNHILNMVSVSILATILSLIAQNVILILQNVIGFQYWNNQENLAQRLKMCCRTVPSLDKEGQPIQIFWESAHDFKIKLIPAGDAEDEFLQSDVVQIALSDVGLILIEKCKEYSSEDYETSLTVWTVSLVPYEHITSLSINGQESVHVSLYTKEFYQIFQPQCKNINNPDELNRIYQDITHFYNSSSLQTQSASTVYTRGTSIFLDIALKLYFPNRISKPNLTWRFSKTFGYFVNLLRTLRREVTCVVHGHNQSLKTGDFVIMYDYDERRSDLCVLIVLPENDYSNIALSQSGRPYVIPKDYSVIPLNRPSVLGKKLKW